MSWRTVSNVIDGRPRSVEQSTLPIHLQGQLPERQRVRLRQRRHLPSREVHDKRLVGNREEFVLGLSSGTVWPLAGCEYRKEHIFGKTEEVHGRW